MNTKSKMISLNKRAIKKEMKASSRIKQKKVLRVIVKRFKVIEINN